MKKLTVEDVKITSEWISDDPSYYECSSRTAEVSYEIGDGTIISINEDDNWYAGPYTCGEGYSMTSLTTRIKLNDGNGAVIRIEPKIEGKAIDDEEEGRDTRHPVRKIGMADAVCWLDRAIRGKLTAEQMAEDAMKGERFHDCKVHFNVYEPCKR